jgi:menaquinone-dependent protoporphyrinogen oxidase
MSTRILVAYASPGGSTAEIAQAVGKELQSAGYGIDVIEMKSVSSLEGYNAVVIGGRSTWERSWATWESS